MGQTAVECTRIAACDPSIIVHCTRHPCNYTFPVVPPALVRLGACRNCWRQPLVGGTHRGSLRCTLQSRADSCCIHLSRCGNWLPATSSGSDQPNAAHSTTTLAHHSSHSNFGNVSPDRGQTLLYVHAESITLLWATTRTSLLYISVIMCLGNGHTLLS